MKKLSKSPVIYICMFMTLFCAMILKVEAANIRMGKLGDNSGITWIYEEDTKTLTVTGEDSGVNGSSKNNYSSPFASICSDVEVIRMKNCTLKGSAEYLFADLKSLKRIEFTNFNTANITSMRSMFYGCKSLVELDLSKFNTSKVTSMLSMFYGCSSLESLDLSSFDTSNVDGMTWMFCGCSSLVSLDVSSFNTSNVDSMYCMFQDCKSLISLDLSNFDTIKVESLYGMFHRCVSLESLDISRFNTSNVNDISYLFSGCNNLTSLDLSSFDLSKVGRAIDVFNTFDNNTMLILLRTPRNMPQELSLQLPTSYKDLNSYDKYSDTMYLTGKYCNTTLIKRSYHLEGIELNECSINIPVGNSSQLSVTVFPIGAPIKEIKWTTSDRSVATVDDGKVSAIRPGTVTITARVTDVTGTTADALCEVRVVLPVTQIVLSEKTLNLKTGETHTLRAVVGPDNATIKDVVWTTSDKLVATVDEYGIVKAVGPGNAVITATAVDGSGKNASCEVAVIQPMSEKERQVHAFVERMYTIVLNRAAEEQGLNDWSKRLMAKEIDGATLVDMFVNSDEFINRNTSDEEYIKILYRAVLGREADADGLKMWKDMLADDWTRDYVLEGLVLSVEFKNICDSYGIIAAFEPTAESQVRSFVKRMYTVVLNRRADVVGLDEWTKRLMNGTANGAQLADGFISSDEFVNRNLSNEKYVKVLYRAFFNREPDEGGFNVWINELAKGASRRDVMKGFVHSVEFSDLCAQYGIIRGEIQ